MVGRLICMPVKRSYHGGSPSVFSAAHPPSGDGMLVYVITGTQTTYPRENGYVWEVLEGLPTPDLVLTGGCIGVDETAGRFYAENYPKVHQCICLPAPEFRRKTSFWWNGFDDDWVTREISTWNTASGLIERNEKMVKEATMYKRPFGIAFPQERNEQLRSGTWATVRRFRKYDLSHAVYPLCDAPRP